MRRGSTPGRATPRAVYLCAIFFTLRSFVDPCEQIRLHLARHRLHSGGQMKHFHPSALPHVSFEYGPQWRLGVMCFECCDLGFKSVADINHSGRRRESNRLPAGQCEIRSLVVQLLRSMRTGVLTDLIGIAVAPSRPLECQGSKNARHGVIGMRCHSAFASKREQDLRPKLPHKQRETTNRSVQILPVELAIRIVEHNAAGDFQNLARRSEFSAPYGCEFLIVASAAATGCGLPRREAHN